MEKGDIDNYFELIEKKESLVSLLRQGSEEVRPIIEEGLNRAQGEISRLESDEDVIIEIALMGQKVESDLQVLDQLSTIGEELVPAELIAQQREEILSNSRNLRSLEIFQELKMLETAGEVVIEEVPILSDVSTEVTSTGETGTVHLTPEGDSEVADESDTEKTYPNIELTIEGNNLRIGKRGKVINLEYANLSKYRDYRQIRKNILRVLVDNAGGEFISARDLWAAAMAEEEFDKVAMGRVLNWFRSELTFRKQPIVTHNGQRRDSAYRIENPNVSLTEVIQVDDESPSPIQDNIGDQGGTIVEPSPSTAEPTSIMPTKSATLVDTKERQGTLDLPLNHAETIILTEFLSTKSEVLRAYGIKEFVTQDKEKLFEVSDADLKLKYELEIIYGGVENAREIIIDKLIRYFGEDNQDNIYEDLVAISEKDFRFSLFCYLFDLQEEGSLELLINEVLKAKPDTTVVIDEGGYNRGKQIIDTKAGFIDEYGKEIIAPTGEDQEQVDEEEIISVPEELAEDEVIELNDELQVSLEEAEDQVVTVVDQKNPETKTQSKKLKKLEVDAEKAIENLIDEGIIVAGTDEISLKIYTSKSNSRTSGTKTSLKRAKNCGIIESTKQEVFSVRQIVVMEILNAYRDLFSAPNNSSRFTEAMKLIDEVVEGAKQRLAKQK